MHRLLENYLSEVAAHLSPLPVKRRAEELREMRTHLENTVIVNRELGQSEDEAARAAVAQFGTARDLGENVVWAWQRGRSLSGKSFFGAVASSLVLLNTLPHLMAVLTCMLLVPFSELMRGTYHWPYAAMRAFCFFSVSLPIWLMIGAGSGRLFPKRAVAGTGLVMSAWIVFQVTHSLCWEFICIPGHERYAYFIHRNNSRSAADVIALIVSDVLLTLAATASAWAVSRWQKTHMGWTRLARN